MSKYYVLAIDPGASGGIVAREVDGNRLYVRPMPATDGDILEAIRQANDVANLNGLVRVAYLEQIVKHMGAGIPASTMAVYAGNWGTVKGMLMALGWRVELPTPQLWQKSLGLGITGRVAVKRKDHASKESYAAAVKAAKQHNAGLKRDWKNKLKATAQRLYPDCRGVSLLTADALLIAEYGARHLSGRLGA